MTKVHNPIQIGPLLVQRVLSSSAEYRAGHGHWQGYICPWNTPTVEIGTVGKLIEVTSHHQLVHECRRYRAEIDLFAQVQLAYYEVIDG